MFDGDKLAYNEYMKNYYKCNPDKYKNHLTNIQRKRRIKSFIKIIERMEVLVFKYFYFQEINDNAANRLLTPENNGTKEI